MLHLIVFHSLYHFRHLYRAYLDGQDFSIDEFLVYTVFTGAFLHALSSGYSESANLSWRIKAINNDLRFGNVKYCGWPTSQRLPDFQEFFAYGMAISFITVFPLMNTAAPWIVPVDPLSLELEGLLAPTTKRIVTSCLNCGYTFLSCINVLCYLLRAMFVCHVLETGSEINLKLSRGQSLEKGKSWIETKLISPVLELLFFKRKQFDDLDRQELGNMAGRRFGLFNQEGTSNRNNLFRKIRHHHNQVHLIMDTSNELVRIFVPGITGSGIAVGAVSNFGVLSRFDEESVRLYVI